MSLFGSRQTAVVATAPAIVARPTALVPVVERATDAYAEIASEIGLVSPALTKNKLMAWLADNSIKIYDEAQVYDYLARQIGSDGRITWRPVRKKDYSGERWYWSNTSNRVSSGRRSISIYMNGPVYSMPIPLHALRLVRDMESALGKESMAFFVSDVQDREEYRIDDPFLVVSPNNDLSNITIIDMWDEPGFGK